MVYNVYMRTLTLSPSQLAKLEYIVADYIDRVLEGDVDGHTEVDATVAQDILAACTISLDKHIADKWGIIRRP